ncbi:MAG: SusC/RagA family TonB-linked outer membrane protein [Cytophagales bacterium]|nr:SusC/RagA family TonB-linked outer membrane protein [Cytophagales bacterium]
MSRFSLYALIINCILIGALQASSVSAQQIKSIKETHINLLLTEAELNQVLQEIELRTDFEFSYDNEILNTGFKYSTRKRKNTVGEILLEISKNTNLKFKQINNSIHISFKESVNKGGNEIEVVIQGITITGRATSSEDASGLPGVNVIVKGTSHGTVTDIEGNYSLEVPDQNAVLVFSSVGFIQEEIVVGTRTVIDMTLVPDLTQLEEIIVVGYGTQKKENLTGAVSSINTDDIQTIPAANTATLLQGRLPGVTVSSIDPQPGKDNPQIRIRGIGTFNSGQEPLVIVDGVQSQLNQIPVSDIENVTVLKDAASASIYGVRAANGVILVTTKRGKSSDGSINVNVKTNWAFQELLFDPNLLASPENSEMKNLWSVGEGGQELYTPEMIQAMRDGSDPDHFANTDWYDEAFGTAPMQTYYMSVSGGNEKTQFMVSGEFFDQEGILSGTAANRYSLRSNLDIKVNKIFKIGLNVFGFKRHYNEHAVFPTTGTGDNSLIYSLRRFTNPTVPTYYSSGDFGSVDGLFPDQGAITRNIHFANATGDNHTDQYRFESRLFAELEFVKGLKWTPSFATIYNNTNSSKFIPTYQIKDAQGVVISENINNNLTKSGRVFTRNLLENLITYQKSFGDHNLLVLGGHTAQYERDNFNQGYIENFPNNEIHELDGGVNNPQVRGNAHEVALESFFGRVNYNFRDTYMFEFNIRHDGSSRMPTHNRWGTFPSFSAGWVMTEESFMSNTGFLSFLKLRGSWGQLGNQEIGNYAYVQNISTGQDYLPGGDIAGGVAITELANPNLTWETTTMTDIGLDINFLDDRLQVVADYFDKVSSDVLIRIPQPRTLGVGTFPYQNVAEVQNIGWELDVKWMDNINTDLSYFVGFNLSRVKNEIKDIAGREDWISGNTINQVGYPIGSYYGYIAQGYFQSDDEIAEHASQWGTLQQGDLKYEDISGPEGAPDGVINSDDRTIIGNPFPEFSYSFNFGGSFKGFDLYAFFQGVHNVDRWNWYNTENNGTFTSSILDYWTPENRNATYWRLGNAQNNTQRSTYYMTDASYVRLKNLEFGYTFPLELSRKAKLERARIFFSGTNLLTWTEVTEFDPEKRADDDRNRFYPSTKTYSLGVHLTF